jgi:hypothetical protein
MSLRNIGIDKISRRDFLSRGLVFGAGARGLAAGYAAVPDVFAKAIYSAKSAGVTNDRVLVMIHLEATGRGSAADVDARYAHLWTVPGLKGTRVDAFYDRDEALAALNP